MSEEFHLGRTQPSLDFVDVDTTKDVPVFIDPRAIRIQDSSWAADCEALLQSFFTEVLEAVRVQNKGRLSELLGRLGEPNETHLGFSIGRSRGRGLGGVGAEKVVDTLTHSKAARTGLLSDLEDTSLLIPGIGRDIVSDITTHVIRGALIGYTQAACDFYGMATVSQHSGPVWNPNSLEWQEGYVDLPRAGGEEEDKLLLVPKSIVRHDLIFNKDKYYNGYLAPLLEQEEIQSKTELVRILKNGSPRVSRIELKAKYGADKLAIIEHTAKFPHALPSYRKSTSKLACPPLTHLEVSHLTQTPEVDYLALMDQVEAISPGNAGASMYHRAVESLLTALLYPFCSNMKIEAEIHEGRKRIDILYDNVAGVGFFDWVARRHGSTVLPVECKNYSREPGNEELDQISGRFSRERGWVGIMTCRNFQDKGVFLKRCRDTAKDGRGFVIALDDADLRELAEEAQERRNSGLSHQGEFPLLRQRFGHLIN
ncbi:hypothetical protein IM697_02130 [Streptomyces ferrugineus]|uniref:Restriction endonuclease type IV Mrr domain-containing protein n=1 Tax=Streptomyces ferrugineus TaxID=1413221 RepID=A0A7M2SPW3_9ACTN|nr:hypothetical protein [Streptomyces ferrugineus]QOV37281.1 hypothetical protein IM697_02130 [Streptomyces ferrugineus]